MKKLIATSLLILATQAQALTVEEALAKGQCYRLSGYQNQATCYDQFFKDNNSQFARQYRAERQRVQEERTPAWLRQYMKEEAAVLVMPEETITGRVPADAIHTETQGSEPQGEQVQTDQQEASTPVPAPTPSPSEVVSTRLQQFAQIHTQSQDLLDLQQEAFIAFRERYAQFRQSSGREPNKSQRVEMLSDAYLRAAMARSLQPREGQLLSRSPQLGNMEQAMNTSIDEVITQGVTREQLADVLTARASDTSLNENERYHTLLALNALSEQFAEGHEGVDGARAQLRRSLGIDPNDLPEKTQAVARAQDSNVKASPNSDASYFIDSDYLMDADLLQAPVTIGEDVAQVQAVNAGPRVEEEVEQEKDPQYFTDADLLVPPRVIGR